MRLMAAILKDMTSIELKAFLNEPAKEFIQPYFFFLAYESIV
jgi:hypothetical protein